MTDEARAWGDFWASNAGGDSGGHRGGCLPERWAAIEGAQRAAWRTFLSDLPQGARVLDLATGDGRVLRWLRAERPDLVLTGIDLAPTLPPPPEGTTTSGGISMESLPFENDAFEAIVSQFGFEYGDTNKVAAEIARTLAPGGKVGLMVHRGDGPILEHNRKRRAELLWALREKGVARKVRNALTQGQSGLERASAIAAKVARQGASKFGETSPAWEISEAIRRSCLMGQRAGIGSIVETIGVIEAKAKNELGRIQSLTNACATADARDDLVGAFAGHGLSHASTSAVCEASGRALADFLIFS